MSETRKILVAFTEQSLDDLVILRQRGQGARLDVDTVVNRAVQVYGILSELRASGGSVYFRRNGERDFERFEWP